MDRHEWIRSIILIAVLLVLVIVLAQSRRECEIPGSSYVPCVSFEKLWNYLQVGGAPFYARNKTDLSLSLWLMSRTTRERT